MQSRGWAITWRKCLLLVAFVTTTGVYSLTAQTTQDLEITRAARHFRRQVYLQYRTNRPEFDRRRAAAARAEEAYRAAGADEASGERLREWLLAAAVASQSRAAMPRTPEFGETRVADTLPPPSPMTGEPQGPQQPERPEPADPATVLVPESPRETPVTPEPEPPAEDEPAAAQTVEPPTESPYTPEMPEVTETPVVESSAVEPLNGVDPFEEAAPTEVMTEPHSPAVDVDVPPAAEMETEIEEVETEVVPPAEGTTPEHQPTPAPTGTQKPPFQPNEPSSSGVNVPELSARIAGHNFAVRGILLDWHRGEGGDIDELREAVAQTESLGRRYGLLTTYVGLLTTNERGEVEELASMTEVFTTLGNAIADLRERYEIANTPAEERATAIEQLNKLSQRLAAAYNAYEDDVERQP